MKIIGLIAGLSWYQLLMAQSLPVDSVAFHRWTTVSESVLGKDQAIISNDGNFLSYQISSSIDEPVVTVIQSLTGNWKLHYEGIKLINFSDDSRTLMFINSGDSMCFFDLKKKNIKYLVGVKTFSLLKVNETQLATCYLKDKRLLVLNLAGIQIKSFNNIEKYSINPRGTMILVRKVFDTTRIHLIDLADKDRIIWSGREIPEDIKCDDNFNKIAFFERGATQLIWYYDKGLQGDSIARPFTIDVPHSVNLKRLMAFNAKSTSLFLEFEKREAKTTEVLTNELLLWSYSQKRLPPDPLNIASKRFVGVLDLNSKLFKIINGDDEKINLIGTENLAGNDWNIEDVEYHWNRFYDDSLVLYHTLALIRARIPLSRIRSLSPDGKYLIGNKTEGPDIFSYELSTGNVRNLTDSIVAPIYLGNTAKDYTFSNGR